MAEPEFDRFAYDYERILESSLADAGADGERFAEYKIGEMSLQLRDHAPRRILDFGCGVGRSLNHLARYFPEAALAGYDPSGASLDEAQSRTPAASLFSEPSALPLESFDLVLAANVMHHIPSEERSAATALCAKLLAPGGSLFVFEHNPYNPLTRRVFERCPFDRDASMLYRREVIALGKAAGLRLTRAAYTLFVPLCNVSWLRAQRLLAWLPAGAQYYVQFEK